ncbi:MAG: hypothetical protein WD294_06020 [Phycisphaeraceae bacterium]
MTNRLAACLYIGCAIVLLLVAVQLIWWWSTEQLIAEVVLDPAQKLSSDWPARENLIQSE